MSLEGVAAGVLILLATVIAALLAVVAFLGYRLYKTYSIVSDTAAPSSLKYVFWLAVIYTISPIDLLPDPILIDDIGVLVASIAHIAKVGREMGLGTTQVGSGRQLPSEF